MAEGKIVVLAIDVQGARTLRKLGRPFLGIFLMPPSMEELRRRLLGRGDTPSEEAERRLRLAEREIAEKDTYDEVVTNDTVDGALGRILEILKGRHLI